MIINHNFYMYAIFVKGNLLGIKNLKPKEHFARGFVQDQVTIKEFKMAHSTTLARSGPFQGSETGSSPVCATKF